MALAANLESEFGQGGFSLTTTLDGITTELTGIEVPEVPLDAPRLVDAVGRLGSIEPSTLAGAVAMVVRALRSTRLDLTAGDLLAPLTEVLDDAVELTAIDLGATTGAIVDAAADVDGVGLDALVARLGALGRILRSDSVVALTNVVSPLIPGGLEFDRVFGGFGADARGIGSLVRAVGSLMAVESATREISEGVRLVAGMMEADELEGVTQRLSTWARQDLADLVQGVDPDDPADVDVVTQQVSAMARDIRLAADILTRGITFGRGALIALDPPDLTARLEVASALVKEEGLDEIRALAEHIVDALQPILDAQLPAQAGSVDAMWDLMEGHLTSWAAGIGALDVAELTTGVTAGFTNALSSIRGFSRAAEEVVVSTRSAFETVRVAIASVDLAPIQEAIDAALAPAIAVVDEITGLVDDARTAIEGASAAVVSAMDTVRGSLEEASEVVAAAFDRLDALVESLHLDTLQADVRRAIEPITDAVATLHVTPVFVTAVDVIDTTADVVGAVPLSLLPDDARAELAQAVEPVKAIDFQVDVADVLEARLDAIVSSLDTDVLGAIEEAYGEVLDLLRSIDPAAPIQQIETEAFEPFLERLRSINPTEILRPLEEALAPIRNAITSFDIGESLLQPLEGAIDELQRRLAEVNPAAMIAPIQARIDDVRTSIRETLKLNEIGALVDTAEAVVTDWFGRLDPDGLVDALDDSFADAADGLITWVSQADPVGAIVANLMAGMGVPVQGDALDTVRDWIRGSPAGSMTQRLLGEAADSLGSLLRAFGSFDLGSLIAELQPRYRRLALAVDALPPDSPLRLSIELDVTQSSPLELLGPFVDPVVGYGAELDSAARSVLRASGSARSSLDAVAAGLRDSLRPLTAVSDRLRSIAGRCGLDPGAPAAAIVHDLLISLTPSRVLTPVVEALKTLLAKVEAMAVDGILTPIRQAITDVEAALAAIDVGFVTTELEAIHAELLGSLDRLRPSVLLSDVLDAFEAVQTTLSGFDPLEPVRAAVDAMTDSVEDGAEQLRPTRVFAPIVSTYRRTIDSLGALNVRVVLDPLLITIEGIALEITTGLGDTAIALRRLQDALPDAGAIAAGGVEGTSVSASIG